MNQADVEKYLESRGTTLWGRAWDVKDPESRRQAAQWLLAEMNGALTFTHRRGVYG